MFQWETRDFEEKRVTVKIVVKVHALDVEGVEVGESFEEAIEVC
jgi:hypothetical protein